jgi:hypothetical protein
MHADDEPCRRNSNQHKSCMRSLLGVSWGPKAIIMQQASRTRASQKPGNHTSEHSSPTAEALPQGIVPGLACPQSDNARKAVEPSVANKQTQKLGGRAVVRPSSNLPQPCQLQSAGQQSDTVRTVPIQQHWQTVRHLGSVTVASKLNSSCMWCARKQQWLHPMHGAAHLRLTLALKLSLSRAAQAASC